MRPRSFAEHSCGYGAMMREELLKRLQDSEDQFIERKLEGAGATVFKKTLVAFANSLPPNRTAVLLILVDDTVKVEGGD